MIDSMAEEQRPEVAGDDDRRLYVRVASIAGGLATALWLWLQLDLLDQRVFSNFYDIQARALLDGHLAVPDGSLGNEAFVVRGHQFLYNPPGPSFLRMPVFLVTDRFDGRLTVLSLFAAWVVTVVVVALLVWRVRRVLAPAAALGRTEAVLLGAFIVVATAGSTVLYLGSVPWVFHEAYAWAIPMTIGAMYALIGVLQRPSTAGVLAAGGFTLGALFSRATAGVACAGAMVLAAAWLWRGGRGSDARVWWWRLAGAAAVPVVLSAAVNWAKFRHPFAFPIDEQVFTALSRHRRDAIEANGGDLFGLKLVWSTVPAYLRPDGIRFTSLFPFISLPADPAPTYRGGVFDLTYRTGSVVAFMPLLVGLSVLGIVRTFRRRAGEAATLLRIPVLGMALVPGGVLFGAYIAHRYTSEFVPLLVVAGAIGVVDLARRLPRWSLDGQRLALGAFGVAAVFGVAANVAVAVSTQALANPGTVLADHLDRQERFSGIVGGDLQDRVVASAELPDGGPADEVHIVGDCVAVYVGTGETFTPWVEAGVRPVQLEYSLTTNLPTTAVGEVPLAEWVGHRRTRLVLEREDRRYRLALRGGGRDAEGEWLEPLLGTPVEVTVATDRGSEYVITMSGLDGELRVAKEDHDGDWLWLPNILASLVPTNRPVIEEGIRIDAEPTPAPPGCEERLARYLDRAAP